MSFWHAYQALPWGLAGLLYFMFLALLSVAGIAFAQRRERRNRFVSHKNRIDIAPKTSRAFIKGVSQ